MSRNDWPASADIPQWWMTQPLTPEQMEAMREEYEREQIASAKSEADQAALHKEYSK